MTDLSSLAEGASGVSRKRNSQFRSFQTGQVAVVVRSTGQSALLHRAISSVLTQTYENWHLYVLNSGAEKANIDDVVSHYLPPAGTRLSVHHGDASQRIEELFGEITSKGKEEFFVLHDENAWHPEFLEDTVNFFGKKSCEHCVAVKTGVTVFFEQIVGAEVIEQRKINPPFDSSVVSIVDLIQQHQVPPVSLLMKRSALEAAGLNNGQLLTMSDWERSIRLSLLGDFGSIQRRLAYSHLRNDIIGASDSSTSRQNALLKNALVRDSLSKSPELLAVLVALLGSKDNSAVDGAKPHNQLEHDLRKKIDTLQRRVHKLEAKRKNKLMIPIPGFIDRVFTKAKK
jgi:hypothetical protein